MASLWDWEMWREANLALMKLHYRKRPLAARPLSSCTNTALHINNHVLSPPQSHGKYLLLFGQKFRYRHHTIWYFIELDNSQIKRWHWTALFSFVEIFIVIDAWIRRLYADGREQLFNILPLYGAMMKISWNRAPRSPAQMLKLLTQLP